MTHPYLPRNPWKPHDATLKAMHRDGAPIEAIASAVNRPVHQVQWRLQRLRLRRYRKVNWTKLTKLLCRPHCIEDVARAMGRTYRTVANLKAELKRNGVPVVKATDKRTKEKESQP